MMHREHDVAPLAAGDADDGGAVLDVVALLLEHLKLLVLGPLLAAAAAVGITYLIAPTFTARTTFLPPQQQQSAAASALASLGALSALAGAAGGLRTVPDQYVALMQSTTIADRIIDRFDLLKVYDKEFRVDARKELASNLRISVGKKDGLVTIEVDDEDPKRAAEIANRHVEELRSLSGQLVLTEAQQRRAFFEAQMKQTRDRLQKAQENLQASGFSQGALKAEPKAAAEGYARLQAEVAAAEVRLQAVRRNLADGTPEVQQQLATLEALRAQLARSERPVEPANGPGYVGKYREFKYQETLFELFARQYEMARLDESRDGALIQVIDPATPPEKKSRPKRLIVAGATAAATLIALLIVVAARRRWRRIKANPAHAERLARLAARRRG